MAEEVELDPTIYGVYPEDARRRLDFMGFEENTWDRIMKRGIDGSSFGSHEVRALISIARGTEPRLLGVVYREIRQAEGLPPDRTSLSGNKLLAKRA